MNATDFADVVATILNEQHSEVGTVALLFAPKIPADLRVDGYVSCLLQSQSSDGDHISRPATIIFADSDLHISSRKDIAQLAGATVLGDSIRRVTAPDLLAESLLHEVSQLPEASVAVVVGVGHVRFTETGKIAYPASSFLRLAEDNWVPHLAHLAEMLIEVSVERKLRLVVDIEHAEPRRPSLMQLLNATGATVCSTVGRTSASRTIDDMASDWHEWDEAGLLGKVSRSIDQLMELEAQERTVLKAQLFLNKGITALAVQQIEDMGNFDTAEPDITVQLSQIAADSGSLLLARDLLSHARDRMRSKEALEVGLQVAWRLNDVSLGSAIATKLQSRFPSSELNIRNRLRAATDKRDYAAAAIEAQQLSEANGEAEAYHFLASELPSSEIPNYPEINRRIVSRRPKWSTLAQDGLVRDALSRGLVIHALEIVELVLSGREADRRTVLMTLDAIEQIAIARGPGNDEFVIDPERLVTPLTFILQYLAGRPEDNFVYSRVRHFVSVEGSGRYGEVTMIYLVSRNLDRPVVLTGNDPEHGAPLDKVHAMTPAFEAGFQWLTDNGPTVLGHACLPKELVPADPRTLLANFTDLIGYYEGRLKDELDVTAVRNWLGLGLAIAPYAKDSLQDLRLLYAAAGIFMKGGRAQEARDLCRQTLILAGDHPQRLRLAWALNADVYKAGGDTLACLIAINCAFLIDCPVDTQDAWQEANMLTRVFRDLALFEQATVTHRFAAELLQDLGKSDEMALQHRYLGLTVETKKASRTQNSMAAAIETLLTEATSVASLALLRNDSRAPIASLLAQLINFADGHELPVAEATREVYSSLLRDDSALDAVTAAVSAKTPTLVDLLAVHRASERARYAADTAYDARISSTIAARFLKSAEVLTRPDEVAFAIELLADRAIASPGWRSNSSPVAVVEDVASASKVISDVLSRGASVVMAGLNESGELVRVDCAGKMDFAAQKEGLATFSGKALSAWAKQYPYGYADDNAHANVFYLSTETLKFSPLPSSPTLVIGSTTLQGLPLNLWRIDQEFAGLTHALASVPSLSWLRSALAKPSTKGRAKHAWISGSEDRGATLAMVSSRLEETLSDHGIVLNTESALPDFVDAKLAIITAHGGIAPGGKSYFARISDEGELSVTARSLARVLRNVDVVVLFVCSGGRLDKDPVGETTAGMAKQLFDAGCSAVIASPWPLDARVTYHWLPSFLDAWKGGCNLAEANMLANQNVERIFPGRFAQSLAMNMYGNPFIRYD
ncbi:CHAT domain-containing protein [Caballeronia sp. M1242]|uniref:CHAT domain-containing protein n=1 Tax=Caballeronia sp. M1242 TaxID=2814653 RepID=UPI001F497879|nr:CHAT domain-containing protein [Caballeronia sp. M1242]